MSLGEDTTKCGMVWEGRRSTIAARGRFPHIPLRGFLRTEKGRGRGGTWCAPKINPRHQNMPTAAPLSETLTSRYYLEVAEEVPAAADEVLAPAADAVVDGFDPVLAPSGPLSAPPCPPVCARLTSAMS